MTGTPGRLRRLLTSPVLLVLLVAPYFGEGLSGSTPPLELLLPWNLAFMAALYGCGALVCREVARRCALGFRGLCLLAVAYAVWEEALVDRYWFFPTFWQDAGIGGYSVVWHTNVLLAVHLTVFHTAVSICGSVLVVEWLAPASQGRPWVGARGLTLALLALAATPVLYGEFDQRPPAPVLAAAAGLLVSVVLAAFVLRDRQEARPIHEAASRGRRGLGVLVFTCVLTHWTATYAVAETTVSWPLGVLIAISPVALGALLVVRLALTGPYGADGVRAVTGLLSFFVLLDVVVGLGGRYDLIASALATAWALRRLYRRRTRATGPPPSRAASAGSTDPLVSRE